MTRFFRRFCFSLSALCLAAAPAAAQDLTGANLTLSGSITQNGFGANFFDGTYSAFDGSLCIGNGCTISESNGFGNPPLKIKWSQADIIFEDTSSSPSLPGGDWRLVINDNNSGGIDRFSVQDAGADWNTGTPVTPFTIVGGAPENAFWLDDDGRVGMGTAIPQNSLHIVGSDSPGIMLEQIGGFGNQRWEMIGNETSFVIRDSDSNTLPFSIDDQAPNNALLIEAGGDVGVGTGNPNAALHVRRTDGSAEVRVENTAASPSGARGMFTMRNNGGSFFTMDNTSAGTTWFFTHENSAPNRFIISDAVSDGPELSLTAEGVLTVPGGFVVGATTLNVPDYVFADDYALRPLSEVQAFIDANRHLPDVPSAADIAETGLDMTDMQLRLLKKVEELTLYTLALEATNRAQEEKLAGMETLQAENTALAARLARIEAALALE